MKNRKSQREKETKKQELSKEAEKDERIKKILKRTPVEELERQIEDIEFNLFIMSISILRYITDYIKHL